jgi:hypothetical protein
LSRDGAIPGRWRASGNPRIDVRSCRAGPSAHRRGQPRARGYSCRTLSAYSGGGGHAGGRALVERVDTLVWGRTLQGERDVDHATPVAANACWVVLAALAMMVALAFVSSGGTLGGNTISS